MSQSTNHVLMVKPLGFGYNPMAARDNYFAKKNSLSANSEKIASTQWNSLCNALRIKGIQVTTVETSAANTPDKVFPNNWFSTHREDSQGGGSIVFYPMKAPNRRLERCPKLIRRLNQQYATKIDLSFLELESQWLEGTGSLVLDRSMKKAYLAKSERSNPLVARKWAESLGFKLLEFETNLDHPVYHTNVMLSIGSGYAVICSEMICNHQDRKMVLDSLSQRHQVIEISVQQAHSFCGNILEVRNHQDDLYLGMSTTAYQAFTGEQKKQLKDHVKDFIYADVSYIEQVGGGGVRCMLAEIF